MKQQESHQGKSEQNVKNLRIYGTDIISNCKARARAI